MSVPSPEEIELGHIIDAHTFAIVNVQKLPMSSGRGARVNKAKIDAIEAIQAYAQTQRIQGAIAELKLIPHWRDGVFINDGMAEDSYYFKRLTELNDQENNHV